MLLQQAIYTVVAGWALFRKQVGSLCSYKMGCGLSGVVVVVILDPGMMPEPEGKVLCCAA